MLPNGLPVGAKSVSGYSRRVIVWFRPGRIGTAPKASSAIAHGGAGCEAALAAQRGDLFGGHASIRSTKCPVRHPQAAVVGPVVVGPGMFPRRIITESFAYRLPAKISPAGRLCNSHTRRYDNVLIGCTTGRFLCKNLCKLQPCDVFAKG